LLAFNCPQFPATSSYNYSTKLKALTWAKYNETIFITQR